MDQSEVSELLLSISRFERDEYNTNQIDTLVKLIETKEIRDFDICSSVPGECNCSTSSTTSPCIHSAVYGVCRATCGLNTDFAYQLTVWKAIFDVTDIPEFECFSLVKLLTDRFCRAFIRSHFLSTGSTGTVDSSGNGRNKITSLSADIRKNDNTAAADEEICLVYAKKFIYFVYCHSNDQHQQDVLGGMRAHDVSQQSGNCRSGILKEIHRCLKDGLQLLLHGSGNGFSLPTGVGNVIPNNTHNHTQSHSHARGRVRNDCGNQNYRIDALLDILSVVIDNIDMPADCSYSVDPLLVHVTGVVEIVRSLDSLVSDLLLPLHSPNEMEEWRDQTPVIQVYHETLVRCMCRVVGCVRRLHDAAGRNTAIHDGGGQVDVVHSSGNNDASTSQLCSVNENEDDSHEGLDEHEEAHMSDPDGKSVLKESVLMVIIEGLLRQWPAGFKGNTPKEVLFLHEVCRVVIMRYGDWINSR